MGLKYDFTALQQFHMNLEKLGAEHDAFMRKMARDLAGQLVAAVKKKTPVDTGNLRRNWRIRTAGKQGNMFVSVILNSVQYASYVEYGHRTRGGKGWWEGKHMLQLSADEIQRTGPEYLSEQLFLWLKGAMK